MASFKNTCMAFVALALTAQSGTAGIVINIWQDGANVRAHSNGGTLDFNVFTIDGPYEYQPPSGGPAFVQTNSEWVGIGYGSTNTHVSGSPITRTGSFNANT